MYKKAFTCILKIGQINFKMFILNVQKKKHNNNNENINQTKMLLLFFYTSFFGNFVFYFRF